MDNQPSTSFAAGLGGVCRIVAGLIAFAAFYAAANRFQLVNTVLYRAAADDWENALWNFGVLAIQAFALLAAIMFLPRRWFLVAASIALVSITLNIGFGQAAGAPLDAAELGWMLGEIRQAGAAAGEFAGALVKTAAQVVAAAALLAISRTLLARPATRRSLPVLALVILPSLLINYPQAAERNTYTFLARLVLAEPPPERAAVKLVPDTADAPLHIVWIMDESIAAEPFKRLILPALSGMGVTDFGTAASMGFCSAPSNVALRSGVDVRGAGPQMDLRTTPSVWGYARRSGYRTIMLDGQVNGSPQNLLLGPELALIDEYRGVAGDLDTDDVIAAMLNKQMHSAEKTFTYALLRGVHFQYQSHYPAGAIPAQSSKRDHYEAALRYSKRDFFDILLDGVDRSKVAVAYLSDHGQNLAEGQLAHCSSDPVKDEFRIPLIAFLPDTLRAKYAASPAGGRSSSQLFPATLAWMGYDAGLVAKRYDNDLDRPTARYVWFGRSVTPLSTGDPIEVTAGQSFPGKGR